MSSDANNGSLAAAANLSSITEKQVFKKIAWRLLPLITIAYIVNFLDRTNVAFAALTMNHDIGLSATALSRHLRASS